MQTLIAMRIYFRCLLHLHPYMFHPYVYITFITPIFMFILRAAMNSLCSNVAWTKYIHEWLYRNLLRLLSLANHLQQLGASFSSPLHLCTPCSACILFPLSSSLSLSFWCTWLKPLEIKDGTLRNNKNESATSLFFVFKIILFLLVLFYFEL